MHFTHLLQIHTLKPSYQTNLGELRGTFSNLIFTELAKGITVLYRDLPLIVFEGSEFSI